MDIAILCNGAFPRKDYPRYLLRSADRIVCCDGALVSFLRHAETIFGRPSDAPRLPDAVVGDMDSLPAKYRRLYSDRIVPVAEQEHNDQTKAVLYAAAKWPEVTDIHILGATGLREDHTIGNLSLLMEYARMEELRGIRIESVSDYGTAFAVTDTCELEVGEGRRFSLFSPDNSLRIRSEGLVWPTDGVVFDNWWKATLNRASADTVRLTFSHPSLALIILD